jgi:UDP-N-acetylglucosamine acyltransferase
MKAIHPTAVIHPQAQIGEGCFVGPYCVIGEHVVLGENCRLHSHVVLDGHTRVGAGNEFFPFASAGLQTQDLKWKGGTTWLRVGDHNVFREHVTVHRATSDGDATIIGSHNLFLTSAHVAHDCVLGDHIIMSGFSGLAGHVLVEDRAILGGFTAVHQFCRIGRMSITGGCAKVVQDVPPFMLADGNPAETRALNKIGLERNGVSEAAQNALKQAHKMLFRDGLTVSNALAKIEAELPASPELSHLINFARTSQRGLCR